MTVAQGTPNEYANDLRWLAQYPDNGRLTQQRLEEIALCIESLSAQVVEYQKELGIRQNMTPTTRFNNICKALEEQKNDSPYSAESWDTLVAENDGLRSQVVELQQHIEQLTGMKFSDRMHAALRYRAETAEAKVEELQKQFEHSTVTRASVPPSVSDGGTE